MKKTKTDLIKEGAAHLNTTQSHYDAVVNDFLNRLFSHAANGDKIALRGYGTVERRLVKSRLGMNPKTGEVVSIPPRNRVFFSVSKDIHVFADRTRTNSDFEYYKK